MRSKEQMKREHEERVLARWKQDLLDLEADKRQFMACYAILIPDVAMLPEVEREAIRLAMRESHVSQNEQVAKLVNRINLMELNGVQAEPRRFRVPVQWPKFCQEYRTSRWSVYKCSSTAEYDIWEWFGKEIRQFLCSRHNVEKEMAWQSDTN